MQHAEDRFPQSQNINDIQHKAERKSNLKNGWIKTALVN